GARGEVLRGHGRGGQRLFAAAHPGRAGGLAARQLHRVEEPLLLRALRPRRQAPDRRPGRQLRDRAADPLPHAPGHGAAGDDRLGVPRRGPFLARRVRPLRPVRRGARPAGRGPGGCPGRPRGGGGGLRPGRGPAPGPRTAQEPSRMIITRSPLRISLGGGGTDLPSYYQRYTGFLIAAAIDKYVCITLHHTFVPDLIIKYSQLERVRSVDEVQHPIIREALRVTEVDPAGLEITSMADIPAGTGLGSSGSFTTALLKALHTYRKNLAPPRDLAEQACHIELDRLKEPIGKQDQYIAAFGGLTCFQFLPGGEVNAWPLQISNETL